MSRPRRPIIPADERFAKYFAEGAPDGCWEWLGYRDPGGYGKFYLNLPGHPKQVAASRAALILAGTDVPRHMYVLHTCDNPPCVNPGHLYVGNVSQNARDRTARGRSSRAGNPVVHGENHPNCKYADAEVDSWRARSAAGESHSSIARLSGASLGHVSNVVRGKYRKKPTA